MQQQYQNQKQPKTDNLENDVKTMMEKLRELEGKLQDCQLKPSQSYSNGNGAQIHSLKELYKEDHSKQGGLYDDDPTNEDTTAPQVVDACFAQVHMIESTLIGASWFLDSSASHHVSGVKSVFSFM